MEKALEEDSAAAPYTRREAYTRILVLSFIWALMVFWVQQVTTTSTMWKEPSMLFKDYVLRFLIDWSAATVVLSLFSVRVVGVLFALNLWMAAAVLSYFVNFQRALSWLTIRNQSGEGAAVFLVALEDASPYLGVLVPLSLGLLYVYSRMKPRFGAQRRLAKLGALVWLMVFLGMAFDHKPLSRLERFELADGIAHSYGYAVTWAAESYYVDLEGVTEHALEQLEVPTDRLKEKVAPVALGDRIAVVQVESLDDAIMNFKIDGDEVTPRLNNLARKGTYLRVQAPKVNGSCDSDFALLFGAPPSQRMAPYRIPQFPFSRSLSNVLHSRGYRTSFYHGVTGNFFERRSAFQQMDFDRLAFREELISKLGLEDPEWTLKDEVLFEAAASERQNPDKFFEFVITGTSHTPFRFDLGEFGRRFFPEEDDRERSYFGTMHYVDHVIGKYVDGLPTDTVVIIYGDHFSRVEDEELGYRSQLVHEFGIVPALLFKKTETGVLPLFEIDSRTARSARLRLIDVTSYLRSSFDIQPAAAFIH